MNHRTGLNDSIIVEADATPHSSRGRKAHRLTRRGIVALTLALLGTLANSQSQSFSALQSIQSSSATAHARFGWRVIARGDWAIISSPFEPVNGAVAAGRVYVHSAAQMWQQVQIIDAPDAQAVRTFGMSIALDGDLIAIGAPGDHEAGLMAGAVYIYRRDSTTWKFSAKVLSPDPVMGGRFGSSVDLSSTTLIVGALRGFGSADRSGSVYVFDCDTTSWRFVRKLYPSTIVPDEAFGTTVRLIDDSTFAVGRSMSDPIEGRKEGVSVFSRRGNTWSQLDLPVPAGGWSDLFGLALAANDQYIAVGVPGRTRDENRCGGVLLYDRSSFLPTSTVENPKPSETVFFGGSLALTGSRLYVGCVQTAGAGRQPMGKVAGYDIAALDTGSARWYSLEDNEGLPHSCPQVSATDSIVLASSPFCDVGGTLDAGMARFFPVSGTVNVEVPAIPLEYALHQNYPNPFNSMTHINFSVKAAGRVKLEVYNLLGQCVKTLLNEEMNAGKHEVSFEAKSLASGPYFYRLFINEFVSVKKMLLLK